MTGLNLGTIALRHAECISILCFLYLSALSFFFPVSRPARWRMIALNLAIITVLFLLPGTIRFTSWLFVSVVRDWLPAPLILVALHEAGCLTFPRPDHRFEKAFHRWDQRLFGRFPFRLLMGDLPRWVEAALEFSYLQCYPIVPSGIAVLYLVRQGRFADHYWTAVLPAVLFCYGLTPWFPAQPPRRLAAEAPEGEAPPFRRLNLWVLDHASIQVNMFPSGHVAGSLATSLALLERVPTVGVFYFILATGIAWGAIRGRYHYTLDVALGAIVGVLAFLTSLIV